MEKGWREKVVATAERNRNGIDFSKAVDLEALEEATPRRRSTWMEKLVELTDAVANGTAEMGKYYLLGEFTSKGGARTTISNLTKRARELPEGVEFDLRPLKNDDGGSALWGAVTKIGGT